VFAERRWQLDGGRQPSYRDINCKPLVEKLRKGEFTLVAPRFKELHVGGRRVELDAVFQPEEEACDKIK
jgi:hypothetical protein